MTPNLFGLIVVLLLFHYSAARVLYFGGVPDDQGSGHNNTAELNTALDSLLPGDTLAIPNRTFWLAGGVKSPLTPGHLSPGLVNVTIQLDGTLKFLPGREGWPTDQKGGVLPAISIRDITGLTITSNGAGTVDGSGEPWWGYINYLKYKEDRPKLFVLTNATDVLVERWHFRQSAYHTFHCDDCARLEIRHCSVEARVNDADSHGFENIGAFNTDGFDVQGRDIYIHDSSVWNQDDCFTVIPSSRGSVNSNCTENILIEDVNASGLGLTIGVIGASYEHSCIRNVTFRRANMHHTFKGIYMKSNQGDKGDPAATAELTNILYEDITMDEPEQSPIWIGPAQEADSSDACSLVWPEVPFQKCPAPNKYVTWTNITLRNILVRGSKVSPGVIYGNPEAPMQGVVFDNVVFDPVDPKKWPWRKDFYYCKGVEGIAMNGTKPLPPCFNSSTGAGGRPLH